MATIQYINIKDNQLNIEYKGSDNNKLSPEESSNDIKEYLTMIKEKGLIGNYTTDVDKAYGSNIDNSIDNFSNAVYLWNKFIEINNNISCKSVAINNYSGPDGTRIDIECKRSSWPGYNYLGKLDSLFDAPNKEYNKIELALMLGNSWNESGYNVGIFNICLQEEGDKYADSLCPCDTCKGYNIKFVGRGLLQLSNPPNYIPVSYILNNMSTTLKGQLNEKYNTILNNIPTGKLEPPLCGQVDAKGNYYKICNGECNLSNVVPSTLCGTIDNKENEYKMCKIKNSEYTNTNCCQVPIIDTEIEAVCSSIQNKENNIYSNPATICESKYYPMSFLTSFIYDSANTSIAVKENNYSFLVNSCSINQGGYLYPIKANDYDWLESDGKIKNYWIDNNMIKCNVSQCISKGLEGGKNRYVGFCTILNILFPNNNIKPDNNWKIKLKNGNFYKGNSNSTEAKLYYT